jgi:hypothetical protein
MEQFRPRGLAAFALLASIFNSGQAATLANSETTAFVNEEYNAFAAAGVDDSCELIWTFTNTISTPPTHGTATAGQAALPYGDQCPGKVFPHAVVKYKWTGDKTSLTDSFVTDVKYPDGSTRPITGQVKRADLVVKDVNLESGKAIVDLNAASDSKGTLTFEFTGAGGVKSTQTTADEYSGGTGRGVTIDRPKIKKGKYNKVVVKWNLTTMRYGSPVGVKHTLQATFTPPKAWNVLGIIRYSQYNVPVESECVGAQVKSFVVDSLTSCKFTATTFRSDFLSQTGINGTGTSTSYGFVKPGWNTNLATDCAGKFPKDATVDNSYLQMDGVYGSCGMTLTANVSVATRPKNCSSDQTLVDKSNVTYREKDSDDTCPGCNKDFNGTDGHIDNFIDTPRCKPKDILDLGNYWTLRRP